MNVCFNNYMQTITIKGFFCNNLCEVVVHIIARAQTNIKNYKFACEYVSYK